MAITNIYEALKNPRNSNEYSNLRGVTDFANLAQFNNYETGYSFLIIIKVPEIMEKLMEANTGYRNLIESYLHILEYEFKGMDGLENMTADTSEISDGISTLNIITKVNQQSASTFSMNFTEKSGSVITRTHELFLGAIKDPKSQFKTYRGLIKDGTVASEDIGYDMETFQLLYINTDNTGYNIEKAAWIIAGQPTTAEISMYNSTKGDIAFKEVSVEFNGIPLFGDVVNKKAKEALDWLHSASNPNRVNLDSYSAVFTGATEIKPWDQ